ncbi:MAG: hypothetical protein KBT48_07330, partial [Firmicutes bacterium]|nr:hypothetical protein [Bacillota bacterium]
DNMCWILDAAEAEGRRKEKVHNQKEKQELLKEIELHLKKEEKHQKEKQKYLKEIEENKQYLFSLVSKGKLELDDLIERFGISKEELEKEYNALYPSGLN